MLPSYSDKSLEARDILRRWDGDRKHSNDQVIQLVHIYLDVRCVEDMRRDNVRPLGVYERVKWGWNITIECVKLHYLPMTLSVSFYYRR